MCVYVWLRKKLSVRKRNMILSSLDALSKGWWFETSLQDLNLRWCKMIGEGIPVSSGRRPVMPLGSVKTYESARHWLITLWNSAASLEINSAENQKGNLWLWHMHPKVLCSCLIASAGRRGGEDRQAYLGLHGFALQWVRGFTSAFPICTGPQCAGRCVQEIHVHAQSGLVETLGA